ncbi:MAG TPA: roadblock/LC7 domain-containing protein [Acinetobacter parvus]|jgi:predicted regulator of Ras-like GTPase activity (Roadblock/LC7/MglB family)|uniref:roadblock/LC7 domain-containing protein n=1 Tax=Acinetobacter parvus TaxID=134533 RepID=UPI002BC59E34|nr:roadblock/LC7 domain-containing protein [Acinetobacter parvus]HRM15634.1 roadblock/LC7 domain-containing protein [Acinetobacter parvus]
MTQQFSKTAMIYIEKTLRECEQCIGFSGAALSNPDGLVLAMHGQISGDEAAACASSLFVESTTALSYIEESEPKIMLIWTANKLLALHQLKDGSIFLITSTEKNSYNTVLKFSLQTARNLDTALGVMG